MKKNLLLGNLFISMALIVMAAPSPAADRTNSVNLGGSFVVAPDTTASLLYVEYEKLLNNRLSLLGRIGQIDYTYDDDVYEEDGDGPGLEVGLRFYPGGNGMRGFYIGGGTGIWTTDWTWIDDKGEFYQTKGSGESTAWDLNFNVGAKIPLGNSGLHFEPNALIGNWTSIDDECQYDDGTECSKESEMGFYAVVVASIGMTF